MCIGCSSSLERLARYYEQTGDTLKAWDAYNRNYRWKYYDQSVLNNCIGLGNYLLKIKLHEFREAVDNKKVNDATLYYYQIKNLLETAREYNYTLDLSEDFTDYADRYKKAKNDADNAESMRVYKYAKALMQKGYYRSAYSQFDSIPLLNFQDVWQLKQECIAKGNVRLRVSIEGEKNYVDMLNKYIDDFFSTDPFFTIIDRSKLPVIVDERKIKNIVKPLQGVDYVLSIGIHLEKTGERKTEIPSEGYKYISLGEIGEKPVFREISFTKTSLHSQITGSIECSLISVLNDKVDLKISLPINNFDQINYNLSSESQSLLTINEKLNLEQEIVKQKKVTEDLIAKGKDVAAALAALISALSPILLSSPSIHTVSQAPILKTDIELFEEISTNITNQLYFKLKSKLLPDPSPELLYSIEESLNPIPKGKNNLTGPSVAITKGLELCSKIGLKLSNLSGVLTVISVAPFSQADDLGFIKDDKIIEVSIGTEPPKSITTMDDFNLLIGSVQIKRESGKIAKEINLTIKVRSESNIIRTIQWLL